MIRSLYTRVVVTFLAAIILGTVIGFVITFWAYREKLNETMHTTLYNFGQDIAQIYETIPVDEANLYVSRMRQLDSYHVRIYDDSGQFQSYGVPNGQSPATVTMDQIKKVLDGEIVRVNASTASPNLLGLPLKTDMGMKAMFVDQLTAPTASFNIKWLSSFVTASLIIGSLFILVASIFLVRPIKKLTIATRQIAAGDFNVELNIKQKGEIGSLARSFEEMMNDLQQLEQMRRDFVSSVSHEVQSPLTSISGYAKALKHVDVPDDERSRYLDIIIDEAGRMSKMSDSLLKLSLLESQSQQMRLSSFDLDEQIRRVIVAIQPQWSARDISFELDLKAVTLTADYDLLNQVWTNLLGNSIKFSEDGGVIYVNIIQDTKNVAVQITDVGIGISVEDQKRIFERFFKADRSHSRKYGGSGMGLAIVKQIVSLHQGEIRVESKLGRGTTITVTLPIITQPE